jgi:hypothetical protein
MKIQDWIKGHIFWYLNDKEYQVVMDGSFKTLAMGGIFPLTLIDLIECLAFDVFLWEVTIDDFDVKMEYFTFDDDYDRVTDVTMGFTELFKAELKKAYPNIGWNKDNVLMWNV